MVRKGEKHTETSKETMRKAVTEEHKAKMSASMKAFWAEVRRLRENNG